MEWGLIALTFIRLSILAHLMSYIQATGQAGRDGELSVVVLIAKIPRYHIDLRVLEYMNNQTVCRHSVLFKDFDIYSPPHFELKCMCCDICSTHYR